jgi:TrwC relaxase/AAA domain
MRHGQRAELRCLKYLRHRQSKAAGEREQAAVAAYRAAHPYASATKLAEVRAVARGTDPHQVPYFDLTVDVVKSVSVLHASYRVSARQARERGEQDQAAALDARADEIEDALMDAARDAVAWLERHATYTRTGHHSSRTGEWRDGDGLVASVFLHHISRDGDPHLHLHVAVWNRVQRADGADEKWRTLDSRSLHNQRLAVAPVTDRIVETRLSALGYAMVPREDGNGAEVGGVSQDVMDTFSSRSRALTPELKALIGQYQMVHGKPPSKRTTWLLGQQAAQNTRRTKAEARRTVAGQTGAAEPTQAQRLAAWEAQTTRQEVQALSAVHGEVARFAAERADRAPAVLDDAAKRKAARIAVAEVQQHHATWSMAQLRFEVHRALPVLKPGADGEALVTEVAKLAVSGWAGTQVVQVTAPDITDVTSLGVRASDGGSIFRPPHEERYCTLAHLDTEERILTDAKRAVPQLVTAEQAPAAERTGLNAGQCDAVVTILTATTTTTVLTAPAGAGKSHTMAEFARLWTSFTGRRVIGLTTSTNAAQVLAHEGLAESYNIAEFLGKIEGSDELRRPIPLHQDDVLVVDEASQLSSGNGKPACGSATATWPRSPPTTGTAASAAPTRKAPTTGPRRCGSPTTCAARPCCCWPGPTLKPPSCPAASRPGSRRWARSARRRPRWPTATRPAPGIWSAPASTPRSTRAAAPSLTATPFRSPRSAGPTLKSGGSEQTGPGPDRSGSPSPTSPATPSSPTPATSTSPGAAPSTPPTSWSPAPCQPKPSTSA